jgi:hypothetical protein
MVTGGRNRRFSRALPEVQADRRYALFRVAGTPFAYSEYEAYVRALDQVWSVGLVPEPLPSALGSELGRVAPGLGGVDRDLADLRPGDL